jgi:cobalt-zinc-cadmium efflux system outer membrane protein
LLAYSLQQPGRGKIYAVRYEPAQLPHGTLCRISLLLACVLSGLTGSFGFAQTTAEQTSLTLHDAIQLSQTSPQARTGQDQVEAVRGSVVQAGLRPNPRLFLQSEDLRPWADNFDFLNSTEDYAYVSQLFELGGKRTRRLDLAKANVRQAEANRMLLNQQIAGRVAAAYWTAVASAGIEKLLEEDLHAVDEIVGYNKARVDAGAMRGIDLIRVQIERDRLMLALEAARREVVLSRIELFRQIGRSPDDRIKLADSLEPTTPVQSESIAVVLAARADVAAAQEAVTAAEADVRLQRALGVPDLDLLGGYKRNSGDNTIYTSLQIPLPFRNRNQGEVARAEATVQLAKDRLQQLELSVSADVAATQEAYTHQQAVVRDILPDMRARARQNLAIMDDAYRTGGVDLLRYLDAERTAFDVEVSALRTLAELQQAALQLQLAYGVQP